MPVSVCVCVDVLLVARPLCGAGGGGGDSSGGGGGGGACGSGGNNVRVAHDDVSGSGEDEGALNVRRKK